MARPPTPLVRGRSACLSAVEAEAAGLELLAGLWWQGVRRVVCAPWPGAPAGAAPDGPDRALAAAVAGLNRLIVSRGLAAPMRLAWADRAEQAAWAAERRRETAENPRRRGLLRALAQPVAADDGAGDGAEAAPPLVRLQQLGAERRGALYVHVARIDPARCIGCDACVGVCPESALTLVKDSEGQLAYNHSPALCTGCRLCVEICDRHAIDLEEMQHLPSPVPLSTYTCRACKVDVHEPAGPAAPLAPGPGLCRICRQTDHRAKLHQVLT